VSIRALADRPGAHRHSPAGTDLILPGTPQDAAAPSGLDPFKNMIDDGVGSIRTNLLNAGEAEELPQHG
jgi:hypothetical protein